MNYRHKLLNQQAKNQLAQKEQVWQQEKNVLQQDIINLQNSTDLKLLEQAQAEAKKLQTLLDNTINLLGNEDIKNLTDLSTLLQGQTLKELTDYKTLLVQKIKDQDTALINLARQKLTGKKDAEKLLNELETKQSKKEIDWETEKKNQQKEREQWASLLASQKNQAKLELNQQLEQQKQTHRSEIANLNSSHQTELEKEKKALNNQQQEQLKKINTLFDENAVHYEKIDFNGLYDLLTKIRNLNQNADLLKEYTEKEEELKIKIQSQQTLLGEIEEVLNSNWIVFKGKDKLLKKIETHVN